MTDMIEDDGDDRWIAHIDLISSTVVSGWAYDRLNPFMSPVIEAVFSTGDRIITTANVYRGDVEEAGYGNGYLGFELDIGRLRLTSGTMIIRFADGGKAITTEPIDLDPQMALVTGEMPSRFRQSMQTAAAQARQTYLALLDRETVA